MTKLTITEVGARKIEVIVVIRQYTGAGLREALEIVNERATIDYEGNDWPEFLLDLRAAGAIVTPERELTREEYEFIEDRTLRDIERLTARLRIAQGKIRAGDF